MCKVVFFLYLMLAAGWDLKVKEIPLWVFGLGMGAVPLVRGYDYLVFGKVFFSWSLVISLSVGAVLLLLAAVSREAVGMGDGVFFLVSGLYLDYQDTFALFFSGLLLCSIFCLAVGVAGMLRRQSIWSQTIPFLPFLVPMGIWIVLNQGG